MNIVIKAKKFLKKVICKLLKTGNEVYYINGVEHLPPPLEAEEEQKVIELLGIDPNASSKLIEHKGATDLNFAICGDTAIIADGNKLIVGYGTEAFKTACQKMEDMQNTNFYITNKNGLINISPFYLYI